MQDKDNFPKPVTEGFSPVLACDGSDGYLAGYDQKLTELVLDTNQESCQRKSSAKEEHYSVTAKKCNVMPRESCLDVSRENCHDNVDNFCKYFYLDNLLTISRSVCRDDPEVICGQVPHEDAGKDIPAYCQDVPGMIALLS